MTKANVLAHSIGLNNSELITFEVTFPRIILAEAKTHRTAKGLIEEVSLGFNDTEDFSKNSASSRAIPTAKILQSLIDNPFIPIAWQKEHKGMQGTEYFTDDWDIERECEAWLDDLRYSIRSAQARLARGVTKQIANRLLEPFMWHTAVVTCSKEALENFFELRCPQYEVGKNEFVRSKREVIDIYGEPENVRWTELDWLKINKGQAEIHMMQLAECMWDAYNDSEPEYLIPGQWHIPYRKQIEEQFDCAHLWVTDSEDQIPTIVYISSVMCARVSYQVIDHDLSEWTLGKYYDKAQLLIGAKPFHASPFEHNNICMHEDEYLSFYRGEGANEDHIGRFENRGWCRNVRGFIPVRHWIETRNVNK